MNLLKIVSLAFILTVVLFNSSLSAMEKVIAFDNDLLGLSARPVGELSSVLLAVNTQEIPVPGTELQGQFTEPLTETLRDRVVDSSGAISASKLAIYLETHYYDWQNDEDSSNRGYQIVSPLTITYQIGNFDFGYRQAYIISYNKTPGQEGSVNTFSDAAFSTAYTFREWQWPLRITLDYNLPAGKATLSSEENNVLLVDSYLTQQSQFGEGHNITPGISVTHALNTNNVIGFGVGYSLKGEFDPNSEVENDDIDPGDEINVTTQWQYSGQNLAVGSGIIYNHFGRTRRDGIDFYQKGRRISYNLTWGWTLPWQGWQDHHLDTLVRFTQQRLDENFSGSARELQREAFNVNGNSWYSTLAWNKFLRAHNFRLATDLLDVKQNDYPRSSINFDAGRRRFGYAATYRYHFNQQGYFLLTARRYKVQNKAELAGQNNANYTGYNISMNLNYQF